MPWNEVKDVNVTNSRSETNTADGWKEGRRCSSVHESDPYLLLTMHIEMICQIVKLLLRLSLSFAPNSESAIRNAPKTNDQKLPDRTVNSIPYVDMHRDRARESERERRREREREGERDR